jgi:hypothetical protein
VRSVDHGLEKSEVMMVNVTGASTVESVWGANIRRSLRAGHCPSIGTAQGGRAHRVPLSGWLATVDLPPIARTASLIKSPSRLSWPRHKPATGFAGTPVSLVDGCEKRTEQPTVRLPSGT